MVSRQALRHRQRYAEEPEYRGRKLEQDRRYRAAHKDEINRRQRERRRNDPEYWERNRNYRRYGLTPDDYHRLLARQGGACAICRKQRGRQPDVDHCHSTGQVRGLLCRKCNFGLGHFEDDSGLMLAAIAYLEASRRDSDELADSAVTAAIAERLYRRLQLALREAFAASASADDSKARAIGRACARISVSR
jgi:hypothetical protein